MCHHQQDCSLGSTEPLKEILVTFSKFLRNLISAIFSKNMCDSAPPPDLVMLQSNIPIGPDLSQAPQCGLDDLTLLNIVG